MSSTVSSTEIQPELTQEPRPLNASYGKLMMWFFIVSDALTFTGFLISYGFSRFKNIDSWPIADEVFTHFPGLHGIDAPMYYVALMTFILIFSSVTMVLAVDAGHNNQKDKVVFYMLKSVALVSNPSADRDLAMRQVNKKESCHIGTEQAMGQDKEKDKCRIDKSPSQQGSTSNATGDVYSPVRDNEKDAWKAWE